VDSDLQKRLTKIRQLKQEFRLDQQTIANCCDPLRSRATVALVLNGNDERYLTESNVSAIEKGIGKILDEYRRKLCG
jgi:hypothetical protein